MKLNCWEAMKCGRDPGGSAAGDACPAALDQTADALNGGKNGGRICWAIAGTFCFGRCQPSVPRKHSLCRSCRFLRQVKLEEGPGFQLLRLPSPAVSENGGEQQTHWLRRAVTELARLLRLCQDIMRHAEIHDLLHTLAEEACHICDAERAIAYLLDPDAQHPVAETIAGQGVVGFAVPIENESIAGYVAKHDVFVNILDTSEDLSYITPPLRTERSFEEQYGFPVQSVLAVPIRGEQTPDATEQGETTAERGIIGVIEVFNKQRGHFTEDDEWFLAEVAIIAGMALQSDRLSQRLADMRRTDRAKSRFVALLMHQIVSPLSTAYTCVTTFAKLGHRIDPEQRDSLIRGALSKVHTVQDLAKKLLDLSAIQEGRALGELEDVDIVELIRAEVENHHEAAREREIRLRLRMPTTSVRIHADPTGLGIVFANLLGNAIKYSAPRTSVSVAGRAEAGVFSASVRDQGDGIASEDLPRLFDEFFRCADVAKKEIPGSGLGLTFVKTLVSRYGGSVRAESRPGKGTSFTVSFPCV